MSKKNEISGLELQDYLKSYQLTRECIVDSISKLRKRNRNLNISPEEVADNEEEILKLAADKAFLDAKLAAFQANRHSIKPPSSSQLDLLRELIAEVEKLNANQAIFNEIVQLSTDALTEFNNIHSNQGQ